MGEVNWLKHHLILLGVIALLVFGGVYGIESLLSSRDAANNARFEEILKATQQQVTILQTKLDEREMVWQQQNQEQQVLIQKLGAGIVQRNQATQESIKRNATLSAAEAAQKLTQQTSANPGEILPGADAVTLSLPVTRNVISSLDLLPTVQANLADTEQKFLAQQTIATNLQDNLNTEKELIAALRKNITDADNACKSEIAVIKSNARKSNLKWAAGGAVFGAVVKALIKGFVGI